MIKNFCKRTLFRHCDDGDDANNLAKKRQANNGVALHTEITDTRGSPMGPQTKNSNALAAKNCAYRINSADASLATTPLSMPLLRGG